MTAMAETIWGDVVCLLLYVCAVLLIIIYISSFVRDQSQGKFVNGTFTLFAPTFKFTLTVRSRKKVDHLKLL